MQAYSNYQKSLDLRHRWIQALHLVDIHVNTFVCEKHFRAEDISRTLLVPSGPNGLIQEIPRKLPLLRNGAVPCFLPGCPKYLSVPESSHPCKRLRFESKENESFDQMINESRETFKLEEETFNVANFAELERKLNLVTINWLLWSSDGSIHFTPLRKFHD